MLEQGLEKEAKNLYPFKKINALQTVGYQEWFAHFDGTYSRETTIEEIKKNTRRYAKRQTTWFRKYSDAILINGADPVEEILMKL
jgi:tRNA dimethylallyltransferase